MQEYIDFFQNNMILSLVWLGLLIAVISMTIKTSSAAYKTISAQQVTHLINKEEGVVVDIRSKDDFKRGHIIDSYHVLPTDIKEARYPSLEKKKQSPIILVCKLGNTAQQSANELVKAGFENVHVLKGGISSWQEANLPLIRGKK